MRTWLTRSALILATAAFAATPLLAQPGPGRHGHGPGGGPDCPGGPGMGPGGGRGAGIERLADELELTAEQRTQIRKIRARYMGGALGDAMDAVREAHRRVGDLVRDPAATEDQIRAAHAAASDKALAAALERHRMHAEVMKVLTEEQRRKAEELRKNRPHRFGPPPSDGPEDEF